MKPIYKITVNETKLNIGKHLISLRISDESGIKSDTCEIALADGNSVFEIPKTGAKLSVSLGYEDSGLVDVGSYIVNEVTVSGPPDVINIRCHAADWQSSLKAKVSGSFEFITVGQLVENIAAKHSLIPKVSESLAGISFGFLTQTNESDMHLLTRLAEKYGAIAKPANGNLIFAVKGLAKSITGIELGTTTINLKDVISWEYKESVGESTEKLKINEKEKTIDFENPDTDESEEELETPEIDEEDEERTVEFENETDSEKKGETIEKLTKTLHLTVIGNTDLIAESKVLLAGFKLGIPTVWVIIKSEHSLDSSGFKTIIEAKEFLSKGE